MNRVIGDVTMGKPVWSDSTPETLSAFMDGELPDAAHGQLLKALEADPELQQRWSRYHLLSDAIRNNLPPALSPDLGAQIHRALESEPVYLLPREQRPAAGKRPAGAEGKEPGAQVLRHTARQVGGWALAASVTAVTILGVQAFNSGSAPGDAALANGSAPYSTSAPAADTSPLLTMTNYPPARVSNLPSPRMMDKFNHMLANHNAYVAGTPVQGMPSYVRLVNFESGR